MVNSQLTEMKELMNVNAGNINDLSNEALYALEIWSARHMKSCDCMTSVAVTIIIYLAGFYSVLELMSS